MPARWAPRCICREVSQILMTVLLVTQNGYGATRLRIVNRSAGTVVKTIAGGAALKIPEGYTLTFDADYQLRQLPDIAQKLRLGDGRFYFITAAYLQLLWLNGEQYIFHVLSIPLLVV
ncbi:hypothetical protein MJ572_17345 [Escherichia coli]|nr:hypothetical protein MJ572_17345 [Escherichia coli]